MENSVNESLFLGAWAIVGSTLGFFALRNTVNIPKKEKLKQCILSIALGLFIAFPLYEYFTYSPHFPFTKKFNIMLSGVCAFGFPDIILRHWNKVLDKLIDKLFGTNPYEQYKNYHDNPNNNDDLGE